MVKDSVSKALTVGVDLGDKRSQVCVLDAEGRILDEGTIATSKAGIEHRFKAMPASRVVLETGTHANWVYDVMKNTEIRSQSTFSTDSVVSDEDHERWRGLDDAPRQRATSSIKSGRSRAPPT